MEDDEVTEGEDMSTLNDLKRLSTSEASFNEPQASLHGTSVHF